MSRAQLTSTVEQNSAGAAAPVVAGKNKVINSDMGIWQRGTSVAIGTNTYAADRFIHFRGAYASGMTVSRQATGDTTNLPNIQYCARVQRDSGNTGTQSINMQYSQETSASIPLAGKTVTFSFYARAGANMSGGNTIFAQLYSGTGIDQNIAIVSYTGATPIVNVNQALTTTWQRFSYTGTFPSNMSEFAISLGYIPSGTAGAADYFEITGIQVEAGSVATPFTTASGTLQGELALCQRYLPAYNSSGSASGVALGTFVGSTDLRMPFVFPVTPRVAPTGVLVSSASHFSAYNGTSFTISAISLSISSNYAATLSLTTTGGTGGQSAPVTCGNSAGQILFTGCEL